MTGKVATVNTVDGPKDGVLQATRLVETRKDVDLDSLRRRFDERLAVLKTDDAGDRLRAVIRKPAKLGGKVRSPSA